ncbi:unnamed protein product [Caenorhabditis angaria]|uniref:Uncharacterized protein n=1 Tax=Caenorhabditis angaria TaxID=860376 RepID=A0A9P1IF86_9PELO|nr:unnamed protein product [Caenorhabditis angaria]
MVPVNLPKQLLEFNFRNIHMVGINFVQSNTYTSEGFNWQLLMRKKNGNFQFVISVSREHNNSTFSIEAYGLIRIENEKDANQDEIITIPNTIIVHDGVGENQKFSMKLKVQEMQDRGFLSRNRINVVVDLFASHLVHPQNIDGTNHEIQVDGVNVYFNKIRNKMSSAFKPVENALQNVEKYVGAERKTLSIMFAVFSTVSYIFYNYAFLFSFIFCLVYPIVETSYFMTGRVSQRDCRRMHAYWLLLTIFSICDFTFLGEWPMFYFIKAVFFFYAIAPAFNLLDKFAALWSQNHADSASDGISKCPMSEKFE